VADEAAVVLKGYDEISAPAAKAIASLQTLEKAMRNVAKQGDGMSLASASAQAGMQRMGAAAEHSGVSHRAAHQSLALVSMQLAQMAGVSEKAHGSIRLLDTVLFSLASTGGAVSLPFLALTVAIAAGTAALSSHKEAVKQAQESYDKVKGSLEALLPSKEADRAKTLAQAEAYRVQLRAQIVAAEAQGTYRDAIIRGFEMAAKAAMLPVEAFRTIVRAGMMMGEDIGRIANNVAAVMGAMGRSIAAVGTAFRNPVKAVLDFHAASAQVSANMGRLFNTPLASFDALKSGAEAVQNKLTSMLNTPIQNVEELKRRYAELGALVGEVSGQMSAAMTERISAATEFGASAFKAIGTAAAEAAMGTAKAWQVAAKAMIASVVDLAVNFIRQHILMAQAAALVAAFKSGKSFLGPMAALAGGLAAIAAIAAIGAGLSAAAGKSARAEAPAVAAAGSAAPGPQAAAGGAVGGTPISSAQTQTNNNVVVNLGVQAIDLAAISDTQLKALAFRVGKVLREAGATGQLTLT